MPINNAGILNALEPFKNLLRVRLQRDGSAWYELDEIQRGYSLDPASGSQLVFRVKAELGIDIDRRGDGQGEKIQTLIELFKATNGEMTESVSALYREKFGDSIRGPIAAAARSRLGVANPNKKEKSTPKDPAHVEPKVPSDLSEALMMIRDAEKAQSRIHALEDQIATLEIELKKAKEDAQVYAGVLGSLRAVTSAVQTAKSKIAQNATVKS